MPLSTKRILKQFKYGMYFNGVNDYVYVQYSSSIDVQVFTLIVWAYYIPKSTSDSYIVFKHNIDHHLSMYVESNTVIFVGAVTFTDGSTIYGKIDTQYAKSIANVFRMYTSRYNGTTFDVFIDETKYYIALPGKTVATGAYPLFIGRRASNYFHGYIAQVLIYSRALSDSEIQYNYQNPYNPITNGLVLWLQADPKYVKSNTWIDLSGYGNDGTIYGAQLMQLEKTPARILNAKRVLGAVR